MTTDPGLLRDNLFAHHYTTVAGMILCNIAVFARSHTPNFFVHFSSDVVTFRVPSTLLNILDILPNRNVTTANMTCH